MTRHLCPNCMEVLQNDLSCYFCKGYYKWADEERWNKFEKMFMKKIKEKAGEELK